jgi:hypothetical protein
MVHMTKGDLVFCRKEKLYVVDWDQAVIVGATVQEGE